MANNVRKSTVHPITSTINVYFKRDAEGMVYVEKYFANGLYALIGDKNPLAAAGLPLHWNDPDGKALPANLSDKLMEFINEERSGLRMGRVLQNNPHLDKPRAYVQYVSIDEIAPCCGLHVAQCHCIDASVADEFEGNGA